MSRELFFKPIIVSVDDMDKFEENEMVKKRPFTKKKKKKWYDWLTNYILETIRKMVGGVKGKIMSLFKSNTTKDYCKTIRANSVSKGGKKPRKLKLKNN